MESEWDRLIERISEASYGVRVEPDSISITVEDAEEDWDAPDVVIRRADDEWIQIERPFAKADNVDLPALLTRVAGTATLGGLVMVDGQVLLRHALLLAEALDPDEYYDGMTCKYERPMEMIVDTARQLGRQLAGHKDDYS